MAEYINAYVDLSDAVGGGNRKTGLLVSTRKFGHEKKPRINLHVPIYPTLL